LLKSLSALPCFNQVTAVAAISGGFSHACFKVEADNVCYFAKMITGHQLETELMLANITASNNLTPSILYHDEQWLISHYIEEENLAVKKIPLIEKITTSIKLMSTFHRLIASSSCQINAEKISTLDITDTINVLFHHNNSPALITGVTKLGREIATLIAPSFSTEMRDKINNLVCCHSDMNFSNILSDKNNHAWLIDFEYACFAPAEFDLAMLIAVNNIPKSLIGTIINLYQQQTAKSINEELLHYFMLFCYLINGLWYYNQYKIAIKDKKLLTLAKQQWQQFDEMSAKFTVMIKPKLTAFID